MLLLNWLIRKPQIFLVFTTKFMTKILLSLEQILLFLIKNEILGKPAHEQEALDTLSMLADRTHQVYTGVSLLIWKNGRKIIRTFYEKTEVTFYPIMREDLLSYIATGDSMDKAGAYGIQGDFAIHVKSINGDYNNVVGLPIGHL